MDNPSSSDRDPVERLAEEFLDRRRRGEPASIDDYADRFPQWADRIREFFPALEVMEGFKPRSGDRTGSVAGPADADAPRLERLGEYRILREIGHGGMGVVYEAIQESMGRRVALKILPLHGRIDAVLRERFRLESRSAGRLQHAGIVPVYGVGEHGGVHYYAMQYIAGHGLDVVLDDLRRLRGGAAAVAGAAGGRGDGTGSMAVARSLLTGRFARPRPGSDGEAAATTSPDEKESHGAGAAARPPSAAGITSVLSQPTESGYYRAVARLGVQVAGALAHAHGQGVLHRDIKPSNLLLDADGRVWVTDFGLAKLEGSDGPTQTGDILGTLRYMAPERYEGWSDRRSDLYGLGVTLYELLTLHPAFEVGTRAKLIEQVIHDPPVAPRKHDHRIPRDLETIVLKAMAKEPAERYATAEALAADLENYLADRPIVARRSGLPERAWRWCRRNPAAAGLLGAIGVAAMALVGIVVGFAFYGRLKEKNVEINAVNGQLKAANEEVIGAKDELEQALYFNNVVLAEREWNNNNARRAEQLLEECIPKPGKLELRGWEWNYLDRQRRAARRTLHVPAAQLFEVAFSHDGRRFVSADIENEGGDGLRVWDVESGEQVRTLQVHSNQNGGAAFSPDGTLIASASGTFFEPGGVKVWDAETGRELKNFPAVTGAASRIAFSPDGNRLAAVSGQWNKPGLLTIWDLKTGVILLQRSNKASEMGLIDLAFSPDGKHIATASGILDSTLTEDRPGEVMIRDSKTGDEVLPRLKGHSGPLNSMAYSRDGNQIATTSWDKTLRIWDVKSGKEMHTLRGHAQLVMRATFSADGSRLASASEDNSAKIWDTRSGRELFSLRGHDRQLCSVSFIASGRQLVTASQDGTLKFWDAETGKEALTLQASSSEGKSAKVQDVKTGVEIRSLPRRPAWVNSAAFSPDGHRIATASIDKRIRVFDASNGRILRTSLEQAEAVWDVAYSPDGTWIATAGGQWVHPEERGEIKLLNAETGAQSWARRAHAGLVRAVVFSPDGTRLATSGGENYFEPGYIKIWDVETGQEILPPLQGHTRGLNTVAFSPDGRSLVSSGFDTKVKIWEVKTRRAVHTLEGHSQVVWNVAVSPDGTSLASTSWDGTVRLWDMATGQEKFKFLGHKSGVLCVAFSPDGTRIASGSDDHTVKVWEASTGREALTLRGHTDRVWRVAFSRDGNRIASASQDGTVKIWDGTPWVEPADGDVRLSR